MTVLEIGDFSVLDVENLRLHYAKTLEHWLDRFERSTLQISSMFDQRFVRAWRFIWRDRWWLFGSEPCNSTRSFLRDRKRLASPWTRAHLYDSRQGTRTAMDTCDVLIVGGGPAGAACAWRLRGSGLHVAILDKATCPRDKVCGGWITPVVLDELQIQPEEYARGRMLQPIMGFRVASMGSRLLETHYNSPVSYGIRRCEFDDYLLRRSGARLPLGSPVARVERSRGEWIVNGVIRTLMLVGAGGTFCPVARFLGAKVNRETVVAAREVEFAMDSHQADACAVRAEIPELYFCPDMKGYGWCFRKGNVLNIGLGRMDSHGLARHVEDFLNFLRERERFHIEPVPPMRGHAYLLYGKTSRNMVEDGALLIGDAAGLAYAQSGEGIRPAIESGLLAAQAITAAGGSYSPERLELYRDLLVKRFGKAESHWAMRIGSHLPAAAITFLAMRLLKQEWFTRGLVLDRWFLHRDEAAWDVHNHMDVVRAEPLGDGACCFFRSE